MRDHHAVERGFARGHPVNRLGQEQPVGGSDRRAPDRSEPHRDNRRDPGRLRVPGDEVVGTDLLPGVHVLPDVEAVPSERGDRPARSDQGHAPLRLFSHRMPPGATAASVATLFAVSPLPAELSTAVAPRGSSLRASARGRCPARDHAWSASSACRLTAALCLVRMALSQVGLVAREEAFMCAVPWLLGRRGPFESGMLRQVDQPHPRSPCGSTPWDGGRRRPPR